MKKWNEILCMPMKTFLNTLSLLLFYTYYKTTDKKVDVVKKWSISFRIIVLMVVTFSISTAINSLLIRSSIATEFIDQALDGNRSITMSMATQMVNGVRFKKESILSKPIESLVNTQNKSFSSALVMNMEEDVLYSYEVSEGNAKIADSIDVFTFEEMAEEHHLVGHYLLLQSPIINGKTNSQVGWLLVQWDLSNAFGSIQFIIGKLLVGTILSLIVAIAFITFVVSKQVVKPLKVLRNLIQDLNAGGGDLTIRLQDVGTPELTSLSRSINDFIASLHKIVIEINEQSNAQWTLLGTTRKSAHQVQTCLLEKDQKMDLVLNSVNELDIKTTESSGHVTHVTKLLEDVQGVTKNGRSQVQKNKKLINEVNEEVNKAAVVVGELTSLSKEVSTVMDVIRDIAEQTNLLALNAAIEAARAGEQGRGFAVVADEVRALAGKTQQSTDAIKQQVENLMKGTNEAVTSIKNSGSQTQQAVSQADEILTMFTTLADEVSDINLLNQKILEVTSTQKEMTNSASSEISSIREISQTSHDLSSQSIEYCDQLTQQSEKIRLSLSKFKA